MSVSLNIEPQIESFKDEKDEGGRREVVRNGSHKPRELIAGMGKIPIRQPRVLNRRFGQQFTSSILPILLPILDIRIERPYFYNDHTRMGDTPFEQETRMDVHRLTPITQYLLVRKLSEKGPQACAEAMKE